MFDTAWQDKLQQSITDVNELCRILAIPCLSTPSDYPLLVPRPFVELMEAGNPNDPLLLQVLPRIEENETVVGFCRDPLNEIAGVQGEAILNKYAGRTLLLTNQECGIHCRFCFRRYFPRLPKPSIENLLAPIESDPTIEEVILSGGDPLMLEDDELNQLIQSIVRIEHVRRIRIHSRLPIALPSRLTAQLAEILTLPKPVYLVLHVNHPNELGNDFLQRRELLVKPIVLSQTVLLRDINDSIETLCRLFRKLIDARIVPYYLHQLDRVAGAAHFEVASDKGLIMLAELRECLSGYAVPAYVREVANKTSKEIVTGSNGFNFHSP